MRSLRMKYDRPCFYHLVTRTVHQIFFFKSRKIKRKIREILKKCAKFSGIKILDFCIMSNHIHLLVYAPGTCDVGEEEILRRIGILHNDEVMKAKREEWEGWKKNGWISMLNDDIAAYRDRMGDISQFMKLFKHLCTKYVNQITKHEGTIWQGRFWSGIVQRSALPIVSCYIDLNPVRARMTTRPEFYAFSGFSEAFWGDEEAREMLAEIYPAQVDITDWDSLYARHSELLYLKSAKDGDPLAGFDAKEIARKLMEGGTVTAPELLHCKVRYFTAGTALGDQNFVEEIFHDFRRNFGSKRKTGARRFRGCAEWLGKLFVLRDLKKDLFTPMNTDIPISED